MSKANLWNLRALNGAALSPKKIDTVVNIDPEDIAVTFDGGSGKLKIAFFQISGDSYKPFFTDEIEAGLAEGTHPRNRTLNSEGVRKAYQELPRFGKHIRASGSSKIYAYTTGAVRYAFQAAPQLGEDFTNGAEQRLGYSLTNISGTREAELLAMGGKALHPGMDALIAGMGGATFEAARLNRLNAFSCPVETGLGSHTALAESKGQPKKVREIIEREFAAAARLFAACRNGKLPLIASSSAFRRVERLLIRELAPHVPLFVGSVHGLGTAREDALPVLEKWGGLTGKQLERQIRPPLTADEAKTWDKKFASYRDRMPIAAQALFKLMTEANSSSLITSDASTRGGVVYALRNGIDVSDILSRPVSSGQPVSLARSAPDRRASAPAPNGRTAPAANLKEPAL